MFEDCNTLAELNAARTLAAQNNPIVEVNNAYNARRIEILNARVTYRKVTPVFVTVADPVTYCGVPVAGRCAEANVIRLTQRGFLY